MVNFVGTLQYPISPSRVYLYSHLRLIAVGNKIWSDNDGLTSSAYDSVFLFRCAEKSDEWACLGDRSGFGQG